MSVLHDLSTEPEVGKVTSSVCETGEINFQKVQGERNVNW